MTTTKKCAICGKEFEAKMSTMKTCSSACRDLLKKQYRQCYNKAQKRKEKEGKLLSKRYLYNSSIQVTDFPDVYVSVMRDTPYTCYKIQYLMQNKTRNLFEQKNFNLHDLLNFTFVLDGEWFGVTGIGVYTHNHAMFLCYSNVDLSTLEKGSRCIHLIN